GTAAAGRAPASTMCAGVRPSRSALQHSRRLFGILITWYPARAYTMGAQMAERPPKIIICSCEDTMPVDAATIRRGCRGDVSTAHQLCRAELEKFRAAAAGDAPLLVGCTQEAPLFSELAGEAEVKFANIRETAGWSKDAAAAGPKMAALLAAAVE